MTTKRPRAKNSSQPSEPREPCYNPISYIWQLQQCKKLRLPFVRVMELKMPTDSQLLKHRCPSKVRRTDGDGNCLFRCFSLALTGSDVYHGHVRKIIVDHIATSGKTFSAFFPESFEDDPAKYLARTEMALPGTWGSDVEIWAAAHLLRTRIFVYTLHGNNWQWVEHNLDLTSPESSMHRQSIYLVHTCLIHYDLVAEVEPRHQHISRKDRTDCDHLKSGDRYSVKHKLNDCSNANNATFTQSKSSDQSLNRSNNARSNMTFLPAIGKYASARWQKGGVKSYKLRRKRRTYMSTEN